MKPCENVESHRFSSLYAALICLANRVRYSKQCLKCCTSTISSSTKRTFLYTASILNFRPEIAYSVAPEVPAQALSKPFLNHRYIQLQTLPIVLLNLSSLIIIRKTLRHVICAPQGIKPNASAQIPAQYVCVSQFWDSGIHLVGRHREDALVLLWPIICARTRKPSESTSWSGVVQARGS